MFKNNKSNTVMQCLFVSPGMTLIRYCLALWLLSLQVQAHAQQSLLPVLDSLTLPAVLVGNVHYEAELQLQSGSTRDFVVTRANRITGTHAEDVATFASNVLSVPALPVMDARYALELDLTGSNPLRFRLRSAAIVAEDPDSAAENKAGYVALPNGRGGLNYEPVLIDSSGFDKARSQAAFEDTLYKYLRGSTCIACHNSGNSLGSGAQAPMHADNNPQLAHEYALTRVNFADPVNSKLVVRMAVDRHNCPRSNCAEAATDILNAILEWKLRIADMLPEAARAVAATLHVTEAEVEQWIAQDKATLAPADRDYIVYTSMHELHNEGLRADELNIVRTGLSKALNSVARWAPGIVNPVDVNGKGLLYKFDIRDYWGWNKGVTRLLFGGSDDDLAFGRNKRDYRGNLVTSSVQGERYNYLSNVSWDPEFAKVVWERVLHGNVEGAVTVGTIPPYINGFRGKRSSNAAGEYVAPADFQWVETAQLVYTLTRPDVYNAIMMIPMTSDQLEDELGVDKSEGMDSYDYVISYDAITIDSRLLWRARTKSGGWYWKTWDIFTGQLDGGDRNIFDVYREGGGDIRFPWWANPVPVFVDPNVNRLDNTRWSFVASLAQPFTTNPGQVGSPGTELEFAL